MSDSFPKWSATSSGDRLRKFQRDPYLSEGSRRSVGLIGILERDPQRKKPQDRCHKRHLPVFVISDSNHEYDAQGDNRKIGCYEKRMGDSSPEKGAE